MTERVGGPPSPSSPGERKKAPNSERFQKEIEKIEKPGETEFEKQKKNRFFMHEEEKTLPPPPLKAYRKEMERPVEDLPQSPGFYKQVDLHEKNIAPERRTSEESPESLRKKEEKQKEKEGVSVEKKERESIFSLVPGQKAKKMDSEKKAPPLTKEEMEEELQTIPSKKKMEFEKAPPLAMKKEEKEALFPTSEKEKKEPAIAKIQPKKIQEEKKAPSLVEPLPQKKEEKLRKKDLEKPKSLEIKKEPLPQTKEGLPILKEPPPNIQAQASASASAVAPYITAENLPLFERMVGTVLQMTNQGLEKCEILLTSPAFVGSKYYGTKIVFEKYASAPDSFNIHLTGSDEAVTTFNGNLEGLVQAFDKGHFSFKVGRLWAEYETDRPLFKRKSPIESAEE